METNPYQKDHTIVKESEMDITIICLSFEWPPIRPGKR